ncbi:MAG: RlmE family RNA methyltransferase [Bacteriovoracaceae bacterium]|jgi:23S rRNA (uridine2552-2'-O)-methyltransferase|nr:RlmE family RNA methyltransferase [Bacteriovoracaceae bacterium]
MNFKVKDHYFEKAKKDNYLARSIYKLEEINQKFHILHKNDFVLDLGYHPGSWIQYASKLIGPKGSAIGIDLKPVNKKLVSIKNITLFEKDVFDVFDAEELGASQKFDTILSDMAPNTTGIKSVDQARSLALVEKVCELLPTFLKQEGNFVIKIFDSNEAQQFIRTIQSSFKSLKKLKPKSTRSVSKEFFVIGKGYEA